MTVLFAENNVGACHPQGVRGRGPLDAEVMIVGVAPAREELRTGKVYSGQTGQLLQSVLRAIGYPMDNCYVTNLLCWLSSKPDMDEVAACLPRLVREIDTIKPKVIIALGELPTKFFTGVKKTSDARGACIWNEDFSCWIISTWQPTIVIMPAPQGKPALIADLVRDLSKIEYIKDKSKDFGRVTYEVVASPVQGQRVLDSDWIRTAEFIALDVECKWDFENRRWTDDIRCLSISDGEVTYTFPEATLDGLRWPIEDVRWTFWNAMFDTAKMKKDQGVDLPIVEDAMLMSYSLDERGGSNDEEDGVDIAVGIHGLKRASREYCGAGFYKVDLKTAPDEQVWEYNAKDAAYTARLARMFKPRQEADSVRDFYLSMILPELPICRDEREHGIYVERAKINALAIQWGEEWLRLDEELNAEAYAYGWVDPPKGPTFNWNSPPQVKRFMTNYLNLPVDNAQAETMQQFSGHPWVAKRLRIKKLDKQIGTYVKGILDAMHEDDRVHPEPSIHGTVSGRKVYHQPLVGTIPTGGQYMDPDEAPTPEILAEILEFKQVRGLFGAPPGSVFIEADFKAAEGYTAAGLSGDENLLKDLIEGWHDNAAEVIFKCKREDYAKEHWSSMRRNAKYFNFGLLFWRGAYSLYRPNPGQGGNLGGQYTLKEIEDMVRTWHDHYWQHRDWSNQTVLEARRTGEQISKSGRKRRYYAPGVYGGHFQNMAANWPIQTLSHDHLIVARFDIRAEMDRGAFPAHMLWDGHDAIYFECPDDDRVNTAVGLIREIMPRPRWFDFGIPVEIKVGRDWADAKTIEENQVWKDGAIVAR